MYLHTKTLLIYPLFAVRADKWFVSEVIFLENIRFLCTKKKKERKRKNDFGPVIRQSRMLTSFKGCLKNLQEP